MKTTLRLLALTFLLIASTLRAAVLINFDSIADGPQPSNFLAASGIPSVTFSGAAGAGGPFVTSVLGNSIAPSPPKILYQAATANDQNQPHILTFTFSPVLTAFSLDRVGKNGGGSTDTWHADFFNAAGTMIGTMGEPASHPINAPVTTFSFTAPPGERIARMDLVSVWTGFATNATIPVDNFVLTSGPLQLTSSSFHDLAPQWNAAGTKIAYAKQTSGGIYEIGGVNANGTGEAFMATGVNMQNYAVSWLGSTSTLLVAEVNVFHELFAFNTALAPFTRTITDGNDAAFTRKLLVPGGNNSNVFVASRDGTTVAWRDQPNAGGANTLTIRAAPYSSLSAQNTNATGTVVLTATNSVIGLRGMALTPNGSKLVIALPAGTGFDLWLYNTNGIGAPVQLTNTGASGIYNGNPDVSPDGTKILFARATGGAGSGDIYRINIDGTGLTPITATPGVDESQPAWAPNGAEYAFVRLDSPTNWNIYRDVLPAPSVPPTVVTGAASAVLTTSATLNGTANPNGTATNAFFQWGLDTNYGSTTPTQAIGSGTSAVAINAPLTGLMRHMQYHFRAVAMNAAGTTNGLDATFTTANTQPVANTDTVELPMDHFNVKANDTDADLDPITVTAVGAAAHGTATLHGDNTVSYTPNGTFAGTDSFSYTISDGFGGTANGTVNITDTTPPVLDSVPGPQTVVAAGPGAPMPNLGGLTTFHDNSGLATFSQMPQPGALLPIGDTAATVKVTDNAGLMATAGVTIHVIAAPAVMTGAATGVTLTSATLNGTVNPNNSPTMASFEHGTTTDYGQMTAPQNVGGGINPVPFFEGIGGLSPHTMYHFRLVATNGVGTTTGDDATFTTANTNPVANGDTVELPMDHFNVKGNDTDADLDALTVTAVGAAVHGTATLHPDNTVSYAPNATFAGTDSFSYTISDGFGGTAMGTVSITDTTPPVLDTVPPTQTLLAGAGGTAPMPDLASLTTFHDNSGLATFSETPAAGTALPLGDTNATVKVTDNAGLMATANVTIHVVAPPSVVTGAASGVTMTAATLNGTVNPNKMATTAFFEYGLTTGYGSTTSIQSLGDGTGAAPLSADLTGLPPHTTFHFRAVATNGTGTSNGDDAMFTTGNSNPVPGPDVILIVTNPARTIDPLTNDTDPDGDTPLTVTGATNGARGTAGFTGNSVTYTAATLGTGTDTFTYTVADAFGGSAPGTVKVYSVGSQAGFYAGLIDDTNGVGGASQITMSSSGKLTGRIYFGGLKYSFKGQLDDNGEAVVQISRSDQVLVLLHLTLLPGDAPTFLVGIEQQGTITGTGEADRSGTSALSKRRFTLLLPPDPAQAAAGDAPAGVGCATVSFSSKGKISIVGATGDGASFSTASALRTDDTFPFFAPIYGAPRGEIYGTITVREVAGFSDLDGVLTWHKPAQNNPKPPGPASFTTTTAAIGSLYVQPKPSDISKMLIYNATGDATVAFSEGDLASPLSALIHVGPLNPATVAPPVLDMKFGITTGLFTGHFTHPAKGTTTFRGVVFPKQNRGDGFFIGTSESGPVTLTPQP